MAKTEANMKKQTMVYVLAANGRIPVSLTLRVLDGSAGVPPALGSTRNGQRSGRDARAPMTAPKRGCAPVANSTGLSLERRKHLVYSNNMKPLINKTRNLGRWLIEAV